MMFEIKMFIFSQIIQLNALPNVSTGANRLRSILTIVFTITGSIALLVITVAGFRYTISHGDPQLIARSKNAIIYALVGLGVSMAAVAIVSFVVGRV
ncbi:MAG TPA: hypothetical protein VF733_02955 [Candidatus Saccharimonadales bacterium]